MKYIGFPRPSYPLWSILERTYFGPCNLESNIQEEETSKRKIRQIGCYGQVYKAYYMDITINFENNGVQIPFKTGRY